MPKRTSIRTFIVLEPHHVEFIHSLQRVIKKKSGKKRQPPIHGIIRGVLQDYKNMLELSSTADFLSAYQSSVKKRRMPRCKRLFAGEPPVVESI